MRGGEEMSLDDAQMMLRAVEAELRRRTGGAATIEVAPQRTEEGEVDVDLARELEE
jgi:hypothetical protein